jgi:carboxyl-terminal processing protease
VLRGFTDPLDRFSRYLPPEAARLRLSRESNGMPSVALSLAGNIAVVRIASFNHGTAGRVAADLKAAERGSGAPLAGIVLDLRGNPGGVLQEGVKTAELLISSGPIVRVVGRNPASDQAFVAPGDSITPRVPVAVLIDGGSASASEIVAAAVQDRGRGVVIGTSSFGKGTVQTVQRLPNGGELILTWAWLVMPSGYVLQHHGVVPTWCTEDPRSSATASQRPRAALDEGGWAALRRSCPPRREQGAADLALAERLLSDERLYQAALDALPAPARLTASAGSPAAP